MYIAYFLDLSTWIPLNARSQKSGEKPQHKTLALPCLDVSQVILPSNTQSSVCVCTNLYAAQAALCYVHGDISI